MLPGGDNPPYRPACPGSDPSCALGPLWQHGRAADKSIPRYVYDSTVQDYTNHDNPPIQPYERWAPPPPTAGVPGICIPVGNCGPDSAYNGYFADCPSWYGDGTNQQLYNLAHPQPIHFSRPQMLKAAAIAAGGTGYAVDDILSITGGTPTPFDIAVELTITKVSSAGAVQAVIITNASGYFAPPANPASVTGGHGAAATFALTWTPATVDLAVCHKRGFKTVQARRFWHGQPGYFFDSPCSDMPCEPDCGCDIDFFTAYAPVPSQTKYLTLSYAVSYSDTLTYYGMDPVVTDWSEDATISVNPNSGVFTVDSFSSVNNFDPTTGRALNFYPSDGSVWYPPAYGDIITATSACQLAANLTGPPGDFADPFGFAFSCGAPTDDNPSYVVIDECGAGGFSASYVVADDGSESIAGSYSLGPDSLTSSISFSSDIGDTSITQTITLTVTDDYLNYHFSTSHVNLGHELISYNDETTYDVTVNLSNPNQATAIWSDTTALLANWDMTDDQVYPWRTDALPQIAPLVSRNEVQENISPAIVPPWQSQLDGSSYTQVAITDPNATMYDGSILGAPNPAGYQNQWDSRYINTLLCCDDTSITGCSECVEIYNEGYGGANGQAAQAQRLSGVEMPLAATQWTNNLDAVHYRPQAWAMYNDPTDCYLSGCAGDLYIKGPLTDKENHLKSHEYEHYMFIATYSIDNSTCILKY